MAAVPMPEGVKTPAGVIVPLVADQVTAVLKLPVPVTLAEQEEVCEVRILVSVQVTETDVMVEEPFTVTGAEPNLVES